MARLIGPKFLILKRSVQDACVGGSYLCSAFERSLKPGGAGRDASGIALSSPVIESKS